MADKHPIAESARKHQAEQRFTDEDIWHADRLHMVEIRQAEGDRVLRIGPARDGRLLEIVVLHPDSHPRIIHAMKLRDKFNRFL